MSIIAAERVRVGSVAELQQRGCTVVSTAGHNIAVFANGKHIENWSYRLGEGVKKYFVDISMNLYQDSSVLRLRFVARTVESPQQAGLSADPRRIAFGLVDLMVSPIPEIKK